jgi:hypothetical protein
MELGAPKVMIPPKKFWPESSGLHLIPDKSHQLKIGAK